MDLAELRIFKAVAEHGGVNKAAARLNRVPSNVTTRVKQLEESLGTKLFVRQNRRLALSEEGRLLLTYADRLLRLSSEAETALRNGKPRGQRYRNRSRQSTDTRAGNDTVRNHAQRIPGTDADHRKKRPGRCRSPGVRQVGRAVRRNWTRYHRRYHARPKQRYGYSRNPRESFS